MKKQQWIAILLMMLLMFSNVALAADSDPVLATINGEEILQSTIVTMAENLSYYDLIPSATSYEEALEYLILNQMVARVKVVEYGFDVFTDEEQAIIEEKATTEYEGYIEMFITQYMTEDTEENRTMLRQEAIAYWDSYGCTYEYFVESYLEQTAFEKLYDVMDLTLTDEEITAVIDQYAQMDMEYFEGNVKVFEYYYYYLNYDIWYMPSGYRGINNLLITVDDDLISAYNSAVISGDETAIEEAGLAVITSKQTEIDSIYARLDEGESFETILLDVGEDEDMTEEQAKIGYMVNEESVYWIDGFAEAIYGELENIGDISSPIVLGDGIHILQYVRDVPSGPVEVTDEILASATEYATRMKKDQILSDWKAECEIVYNQEAIDALVSSVTTEEE